MRSALLAAVALLALAACGQPASEAPKAAEAAVDAATPPAPAGVAVNADETTDEPVPADAALAPAEPGTCIAYLKLARAAALAGAQTSDAAVLEAATVAWKKVALQKLNETELAQFEASSLAVLRDTPANELKRESDKCVAQAPKS